MNCKYVWIVASMAIFLLSMCALGQENPKPPTRPAQAAAVVPAANPADVTSPDAILAALYGVISGPAAKPRDWNRFRSLFLPGARLIPTAANAGGGERARVLTPDDYATAAEPYFQKNSFFEREVSRRTERFGGIMQVFSTYESRHEASDVRPFARGINSIQLFFDGKRWWVVTVFWQEENPAAPLPKEFLPKAR